MEKIIKTSSGHSGIKKKNNPTKCLKLNIILFDYKRELISLN